MVDLDFFTETISIKRSSTIDLGSGSTSETHTIVQEGVKASMQPKELQDVIRAGRKINSTAFTCYTEPTEFILGNDHIVYLDEEYNIVSLQSYPGSDGYVKLYLEKII